MKHDFTSETFMENPETVFAPLREQAGVAQTRLPLIGKTWMTTTAAATSAMMKDDKRFTMRNKAKSLSGCVAGMQWWMPGTIRILADNMLTNDEPDHRRLRKLVDQAFQRRSVTGLQQRIEEIAKALTQKMQQDIRSSGSSDLITRFARPFPLAIISELLGIPDEIRNDFAEQAARMTNITGGWSFLSALLPLRRMRIMVGELIQQCQDKVQRGETVEGLIGDLVQAEADGDRLSQDELIAMVVLLLIAGHETTTHLISGSVLALVDHPDQRNWLFETDGRIDLAVEELLRFVSPVQFTKPRHVQEDSDFHGVELKKGDLIMGGLASANFDPAEFDDPERLDLSRRPNPHLEFGTGIHFCLGFQLARLELKIALQTLFTEIPKLKIARDDLIWGKRMGLRVINALPIVEA